MLVANSYYGLPSINVGGDVIFWTKDIDASAQLNTNDISDLSESEYNSSEQGYDSDSVELDIKDSDSFEPYVFLLGSSGSNSPGSPQGSDTLSDDWFNRGFPRSKQTTTLVSRIIDKRKLMAEAKQPNIQAAGCSILELNRFTTIPNCPNDEFPTQIHDEDYRYECLMAGFIVSNEDVALPIQYNNPDIEALLFPDLFPRSEKIVRVQTPYR
ncbi:3366_t:CDS:2, partial [Entrophospora sp. SA101]